MFQSAATTAQAAAGPPRPAPTIRSCLHFII